MNFFPSGKGQVLLGRAQPYRGFSATSRMKYSPFYCWRPSDPWVSETDPFGGPQKWEVPRRHTASTPRLGPGIHLSAGFTTCSLTGSHTQLSASFLPGSGRFSHSGFFSSLSNEQPCVSQTLEKKSSFCHFLKFWTMEDERFLCISSLCW